MVSGGRKKAGGMQVGQGIRGRYQGCVEKFGVVASTDSRRVQPTGSELIPQGQAHQVERVPGPGVAQVLTRHRICNDGVGGPAW